MGKRDLILISVILAVILASALLVTLTKRAGDYLIVRIDGEEAGRYSLSEDGDYELNGGTNILHIEGGRAWLTDADCPDHLCIKQGKIDENGETITCLPNRLTVTVYSEKKTDVELVG